MTTRSYTSPLRAAEAARTRDAILDAVAALCVSNGYAATTLKAIAAEAGVSVQSVSLAGTKASLLIAAFERAFSGSEGRESLAERPAMAEIMALADADEAISRWLDYVADANARTAGLSRVMETAAGVDPVAADAVADLRARRRRDMGLVAGWFAQRGLVEPENVGRIADEVGLIVGPEAYEYFMAEVAWTPERYREWMSRSIRASTT